jgi:putative FmdB family regulatory protein
MPEYEFECTKCQKQFTVEESVKEHEHHQRVKCPECGSTKVERHFSPVFAMTAKKS